MSLTTGRGPLGTHRAGHFTAEVPTGIAYVEPHPRRVMAVLDGQTVIDTERAQLVHRPGSTLVFAFPPEDVGDLPNEPVAEAPDHVEVPWDAVDTWFEEGRELVHYPPNPYHRVDCRPTRRRLHVEAAGEVLVDTDDTIILFETGLAPKLYVRPERVRMDLLRPSDTTTYCNYKGHASYWDLVADEVVVSDLAWSYEDPLPESEQIRGWLSFDPAKVRLSAQLPGQQN